MNKVRARFCVQSVEGNSDDGWNIRLEAVTGGEGDSAKYFKATPWGTLEMGVMTNEAAEFFNPGDDYYIDFVRADAD